MLKIRIFLHQLFFLFFFCFLFQFQRPFDLEKDLKCSFLHHNNPYLKLSPFKYEIHHQNPEIGVVHDFASAKELEVIKRNARGHMKSTPYVTGEVENAYSKLRTSKVTYMNEKIVKFIQPLSKRIGQVTKFRLKQEQYASENFQVMNYGIGNVQI